MFLSNLEILRRCKEGWVLAYKPNIGISDIRTGAGLLKTNIMLMTVENMRKVLVLFDRGSHQNEQYLTLKGSSTKKFSIA